MKKIVACGVSGKLNAKVLGKKTLELKDLAVAVAEQFSRNGQAEFRGLYKAGDSPVAFVAPDKVYPVFDMGCYGQYMVDPATMMAILIRVLPDENTTIKNFQPFEKVEVEEWNKVLPVKGGK